MNIISKEDKEKSFLANEFTFFSYELFDIRGYDV